jgi:enoyl-CoA hydratase/carnithine racemase
VGGEELVLVEHVDSVAVISFNRPERHNALNDEMSARWRALVREAIADGDVRCILLRGEGRSFSSGRDTTVLGARTAGESDFVFVRKHQDIRLEVLDAPKPVVAAVKGYVFGGAFEIALAADMRVASSDAVFAFPEITYGLVTDTGGSQMLPPLIGPAKTKYLLMTGERIDAATALAWGAVEWVVEPQELDTRALLLARQLAAAPPHATQVAKLLVDQAYAGSIRNGIRQELVAQVALFAGEEHARTKAAAIERVRATKRDQG